MSKISFKRKNLSIPYILFLLFFVVVPLGLIVVYALTDEAGHISLTNAISFFSNKNKIGLLSVSIIIGAINTVICLLIGYPLAYLLSNKNYNKSAVIVFLFIMPMWINFVLRTAATRDLLYWIGLNGGDYPYFATVIGMAYNYLPFAILPLYSTMLKMDQNLIDASHDLGANKRQTFFKTVLPMTKSGIVSAVLMVFMPTMSSFVISDVMGERKIQLIGNTIQFNFDQMLWHEGSFIAFIMLAIIGIVALLTRNTKKDTVGGNLW